MDPAWVSEVCMGPAWVSGVHGSGLGLRGVHGSGLGLTYRQVGPVTVSITLVVSPA